MAFSEPAWNYTLIRTRRKTLSIAIRPDATVEVRCPLHLSDQAAARLVAAREDWIVQKLLQAQKSAAQRAAFSITFGTPLLVLGKSYPLTPSPHHKAGFDGNVFYIPQALSRAKQKQCVVSVYRQIARQYLTEKVNFYAKKMHTSANHVGITNAKTRWGSCSSQNRLNFSLRLIMAEEKAVDYVVVHELAHTLEHNHSPRFWAIVAEHMPDYRLRQASLKALQDILRTQNWEKE